MTANDAQKLRRLTHKLYEHIYSHYKEMEELNDMTDESLILDIDIIEKKHEEELNSIIREKDTIITEQDNKISEQAAEIEKLKARLKALEENQ